jgi:rhodanese-related sulfurtransferase
MNHIICVFDFNVGWQWKFVLCVIGGLILPTTGLAEGNRQNNPNKTHTSRSCAVPLSTRNASKSVQMKPTVFSQLQSGQLFKRGTRKRQTDCYISAKSAGKQFATKTVFLIDLRDGKAFQRYHIPGSLNMPAHTLKTKTFLKSRNLILVNEGHKYKMLETLCLNLREAGFSKVSILAGGLNQWQKQVAPLQSDLLAHLDEITPAQFFPVRDYEHCTLLFNKLLISVHTSLKIKNIY